MTTTTGPFDLKLVDQLLEGYKTPDDLLGENGLLKQFTKVLVERALEAELTEHLGHGRYEPVGNDSGNVLGRTDAIRPGPHAQWPHDQDRSGRPWAA